VSRNTRLLLVVGLAVGLAMLCAAVSLHVR
jgi:F0F1-type ATP synthase membrane subunit c/vacuolar-type H+-ATPase subunit K